MPPTLAEFIIKPSDIEVCRGREVVSAINDLRLGAALLYEASSDGARPITAAHLRMHYNQRGHNYSHVEQLLRSLVLMRFIVPSGSSSTVNYNNINFATAAFEVTHVMTVRLQKNAVIN